MEIVQNLKEKKILLVFHSHLGDKYISNAVANHPT